jgi:hypothetical protein
MNYPRDFKKIVPRIPACRGEPHNEDPHQTAIDALKTYADTMKAAMQPVTRDDDSNH